MKKTLLILVAITAGTCAYAQSINPQDMAVRGTTALPTTLIDEDELFQEAVKAARYDYSNTTPLEMFIEHYPASKHFTAACIELMRAQILTTGIFILPCEEPRFTQFRPTERPYKFFYDNQKELEEGDADYKKLRNKYQQLSNMSDPEYNAEANYYLGYLDYLEGNYDSALSHFSNLPKDEKYDATVPFYRMQILYAKGQLEEAQKIIDKADRSEWDSEQDAEADRIKAECLLRSGNKNEALSYFKKYINEEEEPLPVSAYNCAVLAYETGDYQFIQKALTKAVQSEDETVHQRSYMLLGQSYLFVAEVPKAKMAFEQAAALDADPAIKEAAAYNDLVLTHESSYSPWGDEITLFENFLNTYPTSKYSDNVSTYLTEVYMTTKNYDAAIASIEKIKKPNQAILEAKQRLLYQQGIQDYVNGNYAAADKRLTESVAVSTNDSESKADAYFWRGEARYHLEKYIDARNDYTKAISFTTDKQKKTNTYYSLGYVNFKLQNFKDAIGWFDQYISAPKIYGSTTYYDALARMGDCAYYERDFMRAENYYSTLASSGTKTAPYGIFQQAFMAGLQKKYALKQDILDRLISGYPQSEYVDDAWLEKGTTSNLQNETSEAIKAFKQIVDNYPDSPIAPQAAVQLAMAYNNAGKTAEAQKVYEMVAEKYPNTDEATTALQDLKTITTNRLFAEMPTALSTGDYQKVLDNYEKLQDENIDFRDLQKMRLLAAKAHFAMGGNEIEAMKLLEASSKDMRTEAGSEAKYILAQRLFDKGETDAALSKATELIQSGTPHQYWLARTIILMSDISVKNGDSFTAEEYLKSLKNNYTTNDDIQKMIETRLSNNSEKTENTVNIESTEISDNTENINQQI